MSRSITVSLEWGKHYEFAVTATNSLGEAKKEENKIEDIQVDKGRTFSCFGYVCKALRENPMFIIEPECGWCTLLFKKVILTVWSITGRRKLIHSKVVTATAGIQFTLTCVISDVLCLNVMFTYLGFMCL